jgi:hypothetical protein
MKKCCLGVVWIALIVLNAEAQTTSVFTSEAGSIVQLLHSRVDPILKHSGVSKSDKDRLQSYIADFKKVQEEYQEASVATQASIRPRLLQIETDCLEYIQSRVDLNSIASLDLTLQITTSTFLGRTIEESATRDELLAMLEQISVDVKIRDKIENILLTKQSMGKQLMDLINNDQSNPAAITAAFDQFRNLLPSQLRKSGNC